MSDSRFVDVLIVDDSFLFREILVDILSRTHRIGKVNVCFIEDMIFPTLEIYSVHVIVMDVIFNGKPSISLVREIKNNYPDLNIVGYSYDRTLLMSEHYLEAGMSCILPKSTHTDLLIEQILNSGYIAGN